MSKILLIDFGSTYTKLTAVDTSTEEITATAKAITTIETSIMDGFQEAMRSIEAQMGAPQEFSKKLACSSAAGGLKMVAIGLVPDLTAEAAKRAALGAGARVIGTYSFTLSSDEVAAIREQKPDIILLAGGTDGGNSETILYNANALAEAALGKPIIVAGNKSARDEIRALFDAAGVEYYITDNVMPRLNALDVDPAREVIRQVFMNRIVEAKGMGSAQEFISGILMPTPQAVLKAAEVLSKGSDKEEGLGDLVVVDIGGATTDVHSLCTGMPTKAGVIFRGLEEPFAKRTVEGDLGMRYSALSLFEASSTREIKKYLIHKDQDIEGEARRRAHNIKMVPQTEQEKDFDSAMAKVATDHSLSRHAGKVEAVYSPMGIMYSQEGKDLMEVRCVIGTGGVLIHSEDPASILKAGCYRTDEINALKPAHPTFYLDHTYILSAMGLLAQEDEDLAVRLMKKYLVELPEAAQAAEQS
ncbi:putative protein GlmL [Clostridiaceae bacterium JG1575]|nr:putative protein GlmL [Clostridiaceae bacterium JG1575]